MMLKNLKARFRYHWFHKVIVPRYLRRMKPGRVVIDCGANVGLFTTLFARTGATVYAFEPHPAAFERLKAATRDFPNVQCIQAAVGVEPGRAKLYLHPDKVGSVEKSDCSSLMASKRNISVDTFVEVEVISLKKFIAEHAPVQFIKMDIEGAEYMVINDLLDAHALDQVKDMAVETHERSPAFQADHARLLRRIGDEHARNVYLGWL